MVGLPVGSAYDSRMSGSSICTLLWEIFATPIIRVFRENLVTPKRKSRKIKWLGLEKFSKVAKIKSRKISPFKNRQIKLLLK